MAAQRDQGLLAAEHGAAGAQNLNLQPMAAEEKALPVRQALPVLSPSQRANTAGSQPGMMRYTSALQDPWESGDYSHADLLRYLQQEMDDFKRIYESGLTYDTPITRSLFARPPANLTFKDVSFSIGLKDGTRRSILEPVSGFVPAGELVAIMGPSGCGKSTLLDMLASKKTSAYLGDIRINGHKRDHLFQRIAAYVGQEDVMPQHWTVREAIEFNSRLKTNLNSNVPAEQQQRVVDMIIAAYGLTGVAETFIGGDKIRGCSGGQRRRVTLARGIAQRASIIFADEPTSGLSATDAELCIKALRVVSKKMGVSVLVVIHQPRVEVANLFDKLILLTANPGRMVYSGSMKDTMAFWSAVGHPVPEYCNPTDVYLDFITPGGQYDHVDEFVGAFRQRLEPGIRAAVDEQLQPGAAGFTAADMILSIHRLQEAAHMGPRAPRQKALAAPFCRQVSILLDRKLKLTLRNRSAIIMPIAVPVFVGLLLGVMFQDIGSKPFQQRLSFVFMLLTRICMGGMQQMPQLIEDRTIMKYDISERLYSVPAFIVVGVTVDISLSLIGAVLNCIIMYALSGLDWKYFGMILTWALLNFFVFDSFFSMLAAGAPSLQIAQVCAIPFNSIFMMFSGFMISRSSAPSYLTWIFEVSPIGYAIQSIFCTMAKDEGPAGAAVVKLYGFEDNQELKGISILIAMAVVFRVLQVANLQYRNNIQK